MLLQELHHSLAGVDHRWDLLGDLLPGHARLSNPLDVFNDCADGTGNGQSETRGGGWIDDRPLDEGFTGSWLRIGGEAQTRRGEALI
jgi:hypothetical protein